VGNSLIPSPQALRRVAVSAKDLTPFAERVGFAWDGDDKQYVAELVFYCQRLGLLDALAQFVTEQTGIEIERVPRPSHIRPSLPIIHTVVAKEPVPAWLLSHENGQRCWEALWEAAMLGNELQTKLGDLVTARFMVDDLHQSQIDMQSATADLNKVARNLEAVLTFVSSKYKPWERRPLPTAVTDIFPLLMEVVGLLDDEIAPSQRRKNRGY
jgi:hypothetical protein